MCASAARPPIGRRAPPPPLAPPSDRGFGERAECVGGKGNARSWRAEEKSGREGKPSKKGKAGEGTTRHASSSLYGNQQSSASRRRLLLLLLGGGTPPTLYVCALSALEKIGKKSHSRNNVKTTKIDLKNTPLPSTICILGGALVLYR